MDEKYHRDLIISEIITLQTLMNASQMQSSLFIHRITLCTITGNFGLVLNIINICVLSRQGLNTSIKISLFALAITDVFRIVALNWMNLCSSHIIQWLDVSYVLVQLSYRTASWCIRCADRITMFTAVFITAERCICIMVPLKVKKIVTPFKSAAVLITIDVFNVFGFVYECIPNNYSWTFATTQNKTLIALKVRSSAENEGIAFIIHAVLVSVALFCVIIFTAVLVVKLNQKTQWQLESTTNDEKRETFKNKDRKTVKMVILVATVMVICYTPAVILSVVSASYPEFNVTDPLASLFYSVWTVVFVLGTVNASVNILIYYSMITKYKEELKRLLQWRYKTLGYNASSVGF